MEEKGRAVRTELGGKKPKVVSEKPSVGGGESRNCLTLRDADVLAQRVSPADRPPSRSAAPLTRPVAVTTMTLHRSAGGKATAAESIGFEPVGGGGDALSGWW